MSEPSIAYQLEPRDLDGEYEALTPAQIERRMRLISRRLLAAEEEHGQAIQGEAEALRLKHRAWEAAHLASLREHPERTVGHHRSEANEATVEHDDRLFQATARRKILAAETHTLRQILSNLQTHARVVGDEIKYGSRS